MCVKKSINWFEVSQLNRVYLYTVSNLHINVLLLGQHVEKVIVIMGVINGQIFIIISNISQDS